RSTRLVTLFPYTTLFRSPVKRMPARSRRQEISGRPPSGLRLRPPEVLGEPVEAERLQRRRQWPPGLPVVADLAVPGVDHLLPLVADGLALGRSVDRRRAVPRGRALEVGRVAAAERHRA